MYFARVRMILLLVLAQDCLADSCLVIGVQRNRHSHSRTDRPILTLFQELGDLRASAMKNFTNIQVDESNILTWQGLILPVRLRHLLRSSKMYVT